MDNCTVSQKRELNSDAKRKGRELTDQMGLYTFQRQFRTTSSEGYEIREGSQRIGRVDLHFATENVYATIVLEVEFDESEVARVIEEIDDNLVATASVKREDLNVWVYQGQETGFYTDEFLDEEFGEEDEDEEELEDELDLAGNTPRIP